MSGSVRDETTEMVAWLRETIRGDKVMAEQIQALWSLGAWDRVRPGEIPEERHPGLVVARDPITGRPAIMVADGRGLHARDIAEYIGLHDPQDVIADCDTKLAILDFLEPTDAPDGEGRFVAERTLRLMAYGYRHRSGYREDWSRG